MNNKLFESILKEAIEFEIGPDTNGKTSVFTKKDVMTSHMTHNKAAAPTVEKKWVKVDKATQPETWATANAAYKKAKELGVANKIASETNTKSADFEIDPVTDDVEINFDNGGFVNAGPLTESVERDDFDIETIVNNILFTYPEAMPTRKEICDFMCEMYGDDKSDLSSFQDTVDSVKTELGFYYSDECEDGENFDDEEVLSESISKKRAKLTEGFVIGENNDEMWFDQDAFSSFVADALEINKEDVDGFKVCKEPWFDHDTCDYYTAILSKDDLEDFVNKNLDDSLFGPDFKVFDVNMDSSDNTTLLVKVRIRADDLENKEFMDSHVGPFKCSGFKLIRYDDEDAVIELVYTPSYEVSVDPDHIER